MIRYLILIAYLLLNIEVHAQLLVKDSSTLIVTIKNKNIDTADVRKAYDKVISRLHCSNTKATTFSKRNQLKIQIPSSYDLELLRYLINTKGRFKTVETFDNYEIYPFFEKINELIVQNQYYLDTTKTANRLTQKYPLFALLVPSTTDKNMLKKGPCVGYAQTKDTAKVMHLFALPLVHACLPADIHFCWTRQNIKGWYSLIAVKEPKQYSAMTNDMIEIVKIAQNETDKSLEVFIYFKKEYHEAWAAMTCNNISKSLAILIDNVVYSYPMVQNEIRNGGSIIRGNWKREELEAITCILKYTNDVAFDCK
jgi:SecD/SecF fusion protein